MCQKIPYETRAAAVGDAKRIRSSAKRRSRFTKKHSRGNLTEKLRPYECRCGKWHLTSNI